jgi:predicted nucleotidyltransferase
VQSELRISALLGRLAGAGVCRTLKANAGAIEFDGFEILIASIEDLLAMKRAANRPQDQADVEALTAIQRLRTQPG